MKKNKYLQDSTLLVTPLDSSALVFQSGKGSRIKATDGKSYIDFTSANGVCSLGYDTKSIINCLGSNSLVYSPNTAYSPQQGEAASVICRATGMDRILFAKDFLEAEELSVRFARRMFPETSNKYKIVVVKSLRKDGRAPECAFLPASNSKVKYGETLFGGFIIVSPNDIKGLKSACADKNVCAIYLETIDFYNSYQELSAQFVQAVKEFVNSYNLITIINENDTLGRGDELLSYNAYDLRPDIVCLGKNFSHGLPFGAVCVKKAIAANFDCQSIDFFFRGRPFASAVAKASIDYLHQKSTVKSIESKINLIEKNIDKLKKLNNVIRATHMIGYSCILEFADKYSASTIAKNLEQSGVLVNCVSERNAILLMPPFSATSGDISAVFKAVIKLCGQLSGK